MKYESVLALKQELSGVSEAAREHEQAQRASARAGTTLGGRARAFVLEHTALVPLTGPESPWLAFRGFAPQGLRPLGDSPPGLALGVARGRSRRDYFLGARVQGTGALAQNMVSAIQDRAKGECDVRIVPRVRARPQPRWFRATRRPLEAGLSLGLAAFEDAGTLGCVVEDARGYYLLSNNHVLANVNRATAGDPVVQPGGLDRRPSSKTLIGYLDRFVPISFSGKNLADAALARVLDDVELYCGWNEALPGRVTGTRDVSRDDLDRPVVKVGRTTGVTRGRITQINVEMLRVEMTSRRSAHFIDQIEVTGDAGRPFSDAGDSGSLVVGTDRRAVGLLFCGGPDENDVDLTFANPIQAVLDRLDVRLSRCSGQG